MKRRAYLLAGGLLLSLAACDRESTPEPAGAAPETAPSEARTSALIADQANNGKTGFIWIAPMVPTTPSGFTTLDQTGGSNSLTVKVDRLLSSNTTVPKVTFTGSAVKMVTGSSDASFPGVVGPFYGASWAAGSTVVSGETYRVSVQALTSPVRVLGVADVQVVATQTQANAVDRTKFTPLIVGNTLSIVFRLENKDTDGDTINDWKDNCTVTKNINQLDSNSDGIGNACQCLNVPNGKACSTGCKTGETCQSGSCTGGSNVSNGTSCSSGNLCKQSETCTSGACGGGSNRSSGTSCSTGNPCKQSETCTSGTCGGGSNRSGGTACSTGNPCKQSETCTSGTCGGGSNRSNGTVCGDGNLCTPADTCQSGICTGGTAITCTASDQCHVAGVCNPINGTCSDPAKTNGISCNDSNFCTRSDTCQSGVCTGANPVICVAADSCHVAGTCDPESGTCSNPPQPQASCDIAAFDYDAAGRLIRDHGAKLTFDPYDQLRRVDPPPATAPPLTGLAVDEIWSPGPGGPSAIAQDVNAAGHIIGVGSDGLGVTHGFLSMGSGPAIDLGLRPGVPAQTTPAAIADDDTVTGSYLAADGSHPFFYRTTSGFTSVTKQGDSTYAYDINAAGQLAGAYTVAGVYHGFRYTTAGGYLQTGGLGGANSWAWGIDPFGTVVGSAQLSTTPTTGFALYGHATIFNDLVGLQDLNTLISPLLNWTLVVANRSAGDWVAGTGLHNGVEHGYRLRVSSGVVDDLGGGWAGISLAVAINSFGEAVGYGYLDAANTQLAAWVYTDQFGFKKLNDVIDATSGWDLRIAAGINDAGDVVGQGIHNGQIAAFRVRLPLRFINGGKPTVAEVHTYGSDGLRTSTTSAPGTTGAKVQFWYTQDYTQHDGQRDHYIRIGNRLVARVTLQSSGTAMVVLPEAARAPEGQRSEIAIGIGFGLAAAAGMGAVAASRRRRRRWIPALGGLTVLLLGATSCEMFGVGNKSDSLTWTVAANLTRYFHQGGVAQGPTLMTDSAGAVLEERRYDPFGQPVDALPGANVDFLKEPQNILGKMTDPGTGWSYHDARWMAPQTARWLSPDPVVKGPDPKHLVAPWDLNPYTYAGQTPSLFWDPTGLEMGGYSGYEASGQAERDRVAAMAFETAVQQGAQRAVSRWHYTDSAQIAAYALLSAEGGDTTYASVQARAKEIGPKLITGGDSTLVSGVKIKDTSGGWEFLSQQVTVFVVLGVVGRAVAAGAARLGTAVAGGARVATAGVEGGEVWNAQMGVDFRGSSAMYPVKPGQLNMVEIEYQGSRSADFEVANREAGFARTPKGYTWHHVDDYSATTNRGTLQLVETPTHQVNQPHLGGVKQWEQATGLKYGR